MTMTPNVYVAVVITGLDEETVAVILTDVGDEASNCDLYEGQAAVKLCGSREEAEAFIAAHTADDDDNFYDEHVRAEGNSCNTCGAALGGKS